MKAKEFIKKFGWEASQYWINKFIEINEVEEKFINTEFRDDLKEYVNAWELVRKHGGLINAKYDAEYLYVNWYYRTMMEDAIKKAIQLVESVNADS